MDRRTFLKAAPAGSLAVTAPGKRAVAPPKQLDRQYRRRARPEISVSYPSSWYLSERLVIDLLHPVELFSVSSHEITPHVSPNETGRPDLSRVPIDAVVLMVVAEPLRLNDGHDPGLDVYGGANYDDFVLGNEYHPAFDSRLQWYVGREAGFLFRTWSGKVASDVETLRAVIRSFGAL